MPSRSMNIRQATTFSLPVRGFSTTTENGIEISIKPMSGHDKTITIERTTWEQYNCVHKKPVPNSLGDIVYYDNDSGTYETITEPMAKNNLILLRDPIRNRLILETKSLIAQNFLSILRKNSGTGNGLDITTEAFDFNFDNIRIRSNSMKNLTTKAPQNEIKSINYSGPSIGNATPITQAIADKTATHTIVDIYINRIPYTVSVGQSGQVYFMTQVQNPRETLSKFLSMI